MCRWLEHSKWCVPAGGPVAMSQPTLMESMDAAERHLKAALSYLAAARKHELDAAQCVPLGDADAEDRHRRHMLANRAIATAEKLTREAWEIVAC